MEPTYKFTNTITEKSSREIFRNAYISYHLFYLIMLFIALFYNAYWIYYDYSINIIFLVFLLLVIIGYICSPFTYAHKRIKEYTNTFHGPITGETLFFDNYFIDIDTHSKQEIKTEYKNVSSVKITKSFYIFSIKNCKTKIIIPKTPDDETKREEFIEFINGKIINSKRKIK